MAEEGSNKTIVKNTIFLYIRSFFMMATNLYASRIILQTLGVNDYGLYGAIGSIVVMFTFINGTLSTGTSRFLTYELGSGNKEKLKKTFSASFAMHLALAFILLVLMETVGLWFVNNEMNIPEGREIAANIVYQFSILTCMFSLTQVPYSASVISHERMNIYAYVGVAEAVFKLILVFFLLYIPTTDNLIAYAAILAAWNIGLQIFYRFYCYKCFPESHLSLCKDKSIYKNMLSYSLWDFIGSFCANGNNQGLNILINLFFGVAVNAARMIAYQVDNAILTFSTNFMTSIQPQIVKSYAAHNKKRFFQLIYEGGRYSFFLMSLVAVPILLETDFILSIWLKEVPVWTSLFLRCIVSIALFRTFARPMIQGVHATGDVKFLNLSSGLFNALTYLPLIYILYWSGLPVWSCFYIHTASAIISSTFEAYSLYKIEKYSMWNYFFDVYLRSIAILLLASLPSVIIVLLLDAGWERLIFTTSISTICIFVCVYTMGLNRDVRRKILIEVTNKIRSLL